MAPSALLRDRNDRDHDDDDDDNDDLRAAGGTESPDRPSPFVKTIRFTPMI